MIGFTSRTTSPSSVARRRRTPWVAGWCGPMLTVNNSCSGGMSPAPAAVCETGCSSSRSSVTERSRSRYGTEVAAWPASPAGLTGRFAPSVIPARQLLLVEREQHRLAAHRVVAPLGMALVVLGHEDPTQVGVALEGDPEHVV